MNHRMHPYCDRGYCTVCLAQEGYKTRLVLPYDELVKRITDGPIEEAPPYISDDCIFVREAAEKRLRRDDE